MFNFNNLAFAFIVISNFFDVSLLEKLFYYDYKCKIIYQIPYKITSQGNYCLAYTLDASTLDKLGSNEAILIDSNDVNVDFLDNCLISTNAEKKINYKTRLTGLEIKSGRSNIQISNGCINGFRYGINLETAVSPPPSGSPEWSNHSHNIRVNDMRFSNNTYSPVRIAAENVVVERVLAVASGGDNSYGRDTFAFGIIVSGNNCKVLNNTVIDTYPSNSGEGVGISISTGAENCLIQDNIISNSLIPEHGRTFGIWVDVSSNKPLATIANNTITNFSYAYPFGHNLISNIVNNEHCRNIRIERIKIDMPDYVSNDIYKNDENFKRYCVDDFDEALKNYNASDINSVFRLAQIYSDRQEKEKALSFYKIAADLGSEEAAYRVQVLKKIITDSKVKK